MEDAAPRAMSTREQGLRFVAVGAWNTVFGYLSFAVLQLLIGDQVGYMVVLGLAWIVNILQNYLTYRYLVFKVEGHWFRDLARFSVVYAGAIAFNVVALPVGVDVLGLPVLVAQGLVTVIVVAASFVAHRGYSFRRA